MGMQDPVRDPPLEPVFVGVCERAVQDELHVVVQQCVSYT